MSSYELVKISDKRDWAQYHEIRRITLFEEKGRVNVYDPNHADEYLENNHPLLLKFKGDGIGTTRLDDRKDGTGIVRLVAIKSAMHGHGHGRKLSQLTQEYAKTLGMNTLYVNAAPEAIEYYKATGWKPFPWDPSELTGIAKDCIQMSIALQE